MGSWRALPILALTLGVPACGSSPSETTRDSALEPCGDGIRAGDEACDGADLGGATCASAVAPGWVGSLACSATCTLDESQCTTPETTYPPLVAGSWGSFDTSALGAEAQGFRGAVFDGRYLYLVPNSNGEHHGTVARYDTEADFDAALSWALFDVSAVDADARGFEGGAFDGRYVYLVPMNHGEPSGLVARYDTEAGFQSAASWSTFDVASVAEAAEGFSGAVFDGRYLYLVPRNNGASHGNVARLDTRAPFNEASSWSTFDLTAVDAGARGFVGGAFDGRYVYLVPYHRGAYHGTVARYDTHGAFGSAAAWTTIDLTDVDADARGYHGAVFDGRFLYLIPLRHEAWHGNVARYDTAGAFEAPGSWTLFDVSSVNGAAGGFQGGVFDGRYLYLVPFYNGSAYHGRIARYDTQAVFDAVPSWSTLDLTSVTPEAYGFFGAAFDGRHVYLVPGFQGAYHGTVMRFGAKTPAWLPRHWHASFL